MIKPDRVDVDLTCSVAYVYYKGEEMETSRTVAVNDDVRAAYLQNGDLYGIELLALDKETIAAAGAYAASVGAEFPSLAGIQVPWTGHVPS